MCGFLIQGQASVSVAPIMSIMRYGLDDRFASVNSPIDFRIRAVLMRKGMWIKYGFPGGEGFLRRCRSGLTWLKRENVRNKQTDGHTYRNTYRKIYRKTDRQKRNERMLDHQLHGKWMTHRMQREKENSRINNKWRRFESRVRDVENDR